MNTSNINKHIGLLGMKAKDKISGLAGVISSISFDLYGCVQAAITPPAKKGEYISGTWFDLTRLEIVSKKRVMDIPDFDRGYISTGNKGAADKPDK